MFFFTLKSIDALLKKIKKEISVHYSLTVEPNTEINRGRLGTGRSAFKHSNLLNSRRGLNWTLQRRRCNSHSDENGVPQGPFWPPINPWLGVRSLCRQQVAHTSTFQSKPRSSNSGSSVRPATHYPFATPSSNCLTNRSTVWPLHPTLIQSTRL